MWSDAKKQRLEDCLGDFILNLGMVAKALKLDVKNASDANENGKKSDGEKKNSGFNEKSTCERLKS
jgi:hypothetical protein